MTQPQGLSFSRDTFAKLSPDRFLLAHLSEKPAKRPNGRRQDEFRTPVINTGSLAHSNGSAVVRIGDTAIVCGVRGEILLASDIPNPPKVKDDDRIERLGLVVPNVELSTGCSQAHLPGNPPSSLAQSLSWRLNTLIHTSGLLDIDDLQIQYTAPAIENDEEPEVMTKAYWTLYLDILCMSLDGGCFDAAWLAILAALSNTQLPRAQWDQDREAIICSPVVTEATRLHLCSLPVPLTFASFTTASPLKRSSEAQHWIMADPNTFEEDTCQESVTITVNDNVLVRVEKSGGPAINLQDMTSAFELARHRWQQIKHLLSQD